MTVKVNKFVLTRFHVFLVVFLILVQISNAQEDTAKAYTPFREGRWLLGFSGNVRSSFVTNAFSWRKELNFTNGYQLEIIGGKFIRERFTIGPIFSIARQNLEENTESEYEIFRIGPWFRYYLTREGVAALYPNLMLYYANYYTHSLIQQPVKVFDLEKRGQGPGVGFGLGFNYVIKDIAVLEINLNYYYAYLFGEEVDYINEIRSDKQFSIGDLYLSFGFSVLLKDGKQ
ncbi:MAG: hypothetical protein KKA81_00995 [Bacteroidetes bacterium]|nr:hypothetical protein [Bacteroidota bacterium]